MKHILKTALAGALLLVSTLSTPAFADDPEYIYLTPDMTPEELTIEHNGSSVTLRIYDDLPSYLKDSVVGDVTVGAWGDLWRTLNVGGKEYVFTTEPDSTMRPIRVGVNSGVAPYTLTDSTGTYSIDLREYSGLPSYVPSTNTQGWEIEEWGASERLFTAPNGERFEVVVSPFAGTDAPDAVVEFARDRDGERDVTRGEIDYLSFGKWMDHAGYFVADLHGDDVAGSYGVPLVASDGGMSGSLPTIKPGRIKARWNASVVGYDANNRMGVTGSLELHYGSYCCGWATDWEIITKLTRADGFKYYQGFSYWWNRDNGVTAKEDGTFSARTIQYSSEYSTLEGAFYGPNHEEIAGTFEWHDKGPSWDEHVIGSFGGKRAY